MHDGKHAILHHPSFLLFFCIGLLLLFSQVIYDRSSTIDAASVFDSALTFGMANISVTVVVLPPSIFITAPENITYTTTTLTLNVTIQNASLLAVDQTFYALDDGENITLTLDDAGGNTTAFTATLGAHTIIVFANNTQGDLNTSSVTFTVAEEAVGGGGGGGGGGLGGTTPAGESSPTSAVIDLDTYAEQTVMITKPGKLSIIWGGEEYSARISSPTAVTIKIDFSSLGTALTIRVGEKTGMDLNNDGKIDIIISIDKIERNAVTITGARAPGEQPPIKTVEEEPKQEEPSPRSLITTTKKALLNKDLLGVVLLILIAGIIVEVERRRKKKIRKGRKHL